MKHIFITLIALLITGTQLHAQTFKNNQDTIVAISNLTDTDVRATLKGISNLTDRIVYYRALPVEKQNYGNANAVGAPLLKVSNSAERTPENFTEYLQFLSEEGLGEEGQAMLILMTSGKTNEAYAAAIAAMERPTPIYSMKILTLRQATYVYTDVVFNDRGATQTQKANALAKALLLPIKDGLSFVQPLIGRWVLHGHMCTTHTVNEVYTKLENDFKPVIKTPQTAMWWGLHITSKVN
jgi:hypothetical protein